jgi:hypothetical protein
MNGFSLSTRINPEQPHLNKTSYPASKLEAGYAVRTNAMTYASYFGNGSGRDTYIV